MEVATIHMGLNTAPDFEVPARINEMTESNRYYTLKDVTRAIELKRAIEKAIEEVGSCHLSWECTGRTRHSMHARQWSKALPQYEFTIGDNYECLVERIEA